MIQINDKTTRDGETFTQLPDNKKKHMGGDAILAICKIQGLDPNMVRRIVIDYVVNDVGRMYIEYYTSKAMIDIQHVAGLDVEVKIVE